MSHALELLALSRRPCPTHPTADAKCVLGDGTPACVDCAKAEAVADAAFPADDARHGTYAGAVAHYVAGSLLCDPCADAKRVYSRRHHKEVKLGRRRLVDATPARRHVERLIRGGMTQADVAREAGLGNDSVRFIRREAIRINVKTLAAIAAVRPATQSQTFGRRDIAARKILALHAIGYELSWVARSLGMKPQALANIIHDYRPTQNRVTRTTWDAVAALYDAHHMTPGPSTRARADAARKGHHPPLAWDDIEDPTCAPVGTATVPATIAEKYAEERAHRLAQLQDAVELGHVLVRVCADLDLAPASLRRWCTRTGHLDLWDALSSSTRTSSNADAQRGAA